MLVVAPDAAERLAATECIGHLEAVTERVWPTEEDITFQLLYLIT
jgi:hypothetical protein